MKTGFFGSGEAVDLVSFVSNDWWTAHGLSSTLLLLNHMFDLRVGRERDCIHDLGSYSLIAGV